MARISDDLTRIRKEMRLSKQDIFDKCRIPLETIDSIEDGSIFSGKTRNTTYLRSYFRGYAKAIGIRDEDMVKALDEHNADDYKGLLIEKYLQTGKQETHSSNPSEVEPDDIVKEEKKAKRITPKSQGKTLDDVEKEDKSVKKTRSTSTSGYASAETYNPDISPVKSPPPPDVKEVDWAGKVKNAIYKPQKNRLLWVSFATIIALGLAGVFMYWYWENQEENALVSPPAYESRELEAIPAPDEPETVVPDTDPQEADPQETNDETVTAIATEPDEPETLEESTPEPDIDLKTFTSLENADTLHVYVYALHGNMEPVRVQSDIFLPGEEGVSLRPYWIEHREAMEFEFTNDIIFQGALSRMVLVVNGHIIQDFSDLYLDGPRIQLSRSYIQDNNHFLTPAETPFESIASPRTIIERPRFSQ